jgi:hypothetical protein
MKKVIISIKCFMQINKIKVKLFKGIRSFVNQNTKNLLFNMAFNIYITKIPVIIELNSC